MVYRKAPGGAVILLSMKFSCHLFSELKSKSIHPLVYVQYKFNGDEHSIRVLSHGNNKAKSAQPYHRTMATMKERLKSITTMNKPSASIYKELEQAGGINNIKFSGEIARNLRQEKYFRECQSTSNTSEST